MPGALQDGVGARLASAAVHRGHASRSSVQRLARPEGVDPEM